MRVGIDTPNYTQTDEVLFAVEYHLLDSTSILQDIQTKYDLPIGADTYL